LTGCPSSSGTWDGTVHARVSSRGASPSGTWEKTLHSRSTEAEKGSGACTNSHALGFGIDRILSIDSKKKGTSIIDCFQDALKLAHSNSSLTSAWQVVDNYLTTVFSNLLALPTQANLTG
jgi:hypothetical protein